MKAYEYQTFDVFTESRFGGNPLAVVFDAQGLDGVAMQKIAREFNLSETTFVTAPETAGGTARVRIFTPVYEMPFAGHPTIGTAVALALKSQGEGDFATDLILELNAGPTPVLVSRKGTAPAFGRFISPALPEEPVALNAAQLEHVASALGLAPSDIGFDGHGPRFVKAGNVFLFVPVASLEALARSEIDLAKFRASRGDTKIVGALVYARGGEGAGTDFRVRMFAPEAGVMEDPATGSAAATFPGQIHFFSQLNDGSHDWLVEQGYEMGRPSQIHLSADVKQGRIVEVRVAGSAVKVSEGRIEA